MSASIALPLQMLRHRTGLVLRFILGSLGRAVLTSGTIVVLYQFLAVVVGQPGGLLGRWMGQLLHRAGVELSLGPVAILLAAVQIAAIALAYDSRICEHRILNEVELGTMERVIAHVLGLSADYFDERTHGELIQTVRQDVTNLRMIVAAEAALLLEGAQALGLIAVATRLSPALALWAFLLIPIAAVPITIAARRTLLASATVRRRNAAVFDILLQLVHGIRIIKIYESEEHETVQTGERARGYFAELHAMERLRSLARVAVESMSGVNMVIVAFVGGLQVLRGTLGWPELLAFFLAARAVQGPLNNMNTAWLDIRRHGASVNNLDAMLRTTPTVRDAPDARTLPAAPEAIEARDVGFLRGDRAILDGVSFSLRAGETLGIVGPSGAGKSTLLNLIARFYDPSSGSIAFDGTDLRALRLSDVHARMAIVTQDPFLFMATIADNIARGRPSATQEEIEAAARAAEIHDDIVAMPEGYATVVGHGGRALSRGEAQRINIARAILKNAPILLLDEATSSLDPWSEARVQKALERLVEGRMVFSIAHRLSTLRNATRILVLDGGRAVGLSSHAELLATCETYRRLWFAQTHEEREVPA